MIQNIFHHFFSDLEGVSVFSHRGIGVGEIIINLGDFLLIFRQVASENKRNFDDDVLKAGQSMIGLQYGTNKGASQAGMTPYGASRQIRLEGERTGQREGNID